MNSIYESLGKVRPTTEGDWDIRKEYSILSIVYDADANKSYISKKDVPINISILNREYWQPFANNRIDSDSIVLLSNKKDNGYINSYTLKEAINNISVKDRRIGMFISFYEKPNSESELYRWNLYQFNSNNIDDWNDVTAWSSIYYNKTKFYGLQLTEEALINIKKNPDIGDYAYVGETLKDAVIYRCINKNIWTPTKEKAIDYVTVTLNGNITVGPNGNWFENGVDTGIKAVGPKGDKGDNIKGDKGDTPIIRLDKSSGYVQYGYDGVSWNNIIPISDFVVNNKPDDEDIKSENDKLKFADRSYSPESFSGKGYKILRKNISSGKNILSQEMINDSNTIYEIRYDYDLNGTTINIPDNCILKFEGGSLNNGNIQNIGKVQNIFKGNALIKSFSSKILEIKCSNYGINNESEPSFNQSILQAALDAEITIFCDNGFTSNDATITTDDSITLENYLSIKTIVKIYGEGTLYFPNSNGFVYNSKSYSNGSNICGIAIRSKNHCIDFSNNAEENRPYNVYISTFKDLTLVSDESSCVYGGLVHGIGGDVLLFDCKFDNIWFRSPTWAFEDIIGNLKIVVSRIAGVVKKGYFKNFCPHMIRDCNTTYKESEWFIYITSEFANKSRIDCYLKNLNIETYTKGILGTDENEWNNFTNEKYAIFHFETINFVYKDMSLQNVTNVIVYPYLLATFDDIIEFYNKKDTDIIIKCKDLHGALSYNKSNTTIYAILKNYSEEDPFILYRNQILLYAYDNIIREKKLLYIDNSLKNSLFGNIKKEITDEDYTESNSSFPIKGFYNEFNVTKTVSNLVTRYTEENIDYNILYPEFFVIYNKGTSNLIFNTNGSNGCTRNLIIKPNNCALFSFLFYENGGQRYTPIWVSDEKINEIGETNKRPTNPNIGFQYFDIELKKPIYWTGEKWVDATGADI